LRESRWERARRTPRRYDERRDRGRDRPRGELRPRPLGDRCNPLCPFFKCAKNALRIRIERYRGRTIRVAWCEWIGDKCIGTACKYASCAKNALLPDGKCAFAVRRKPPEKDFEEELAELEKESKKFGFEDYF